MRTRSSSFTRLLLLLLPAALLCLTTPLRADSGAGSRPEAALSAGPDGRYLFSVSLHTAEEIRGLLERAEKLAGRLQPGKDNPGIALVLHGEEIAIFSRKNYGKYRVLVDKAARLDASRVIDIKICETQMRRMGIRKEDLPPFIETVPYGPEEIRRLRRRGYVYF